MDPFFFTVGTKLPLKVIPNISFHEDGHPVLTYTYHVFHDRQNGHQEQINEQQSIKSEKENNIDYMGYITFEVPDKLFNYTADGASELSSEEVEEVIEQITHYRETPNMW